MLLCWLFRNRIERDIRNLADSHVLSIITAENELKTDFQARWKAVSTANLPPIWQKVKPFSLFFLKIYARSR